MGILPGFGPLGSGPSGPGSGFSVMPYESSNLLSPLNHSFVVWLSRFLRRSK